MLPSFEQTDCHVEPGKVLGQFSEYKAPPGASRPRRRMRDARISRVAWTVLLEKIKSKAPAGIPCSVGLRSKSSLPKRRNGKAENRSRARSKNAGVTSVYQYSVWSAGRSGSIDAVLLPGSSTYLKHTKRFVRTARRDQSAHRAGSHTVYISQRR